MKKIILSFALLCFGLCAFAYDTTPFIKPSSGIKNYVKTDYTIVSKFGDYFRSPKLKFRHVFNEQGLEIESVTLSATDEIMDKIIYAYDEKNNLLGQTCYDADGNLLWKNTNTYSPAGQKIETAEYNAGSSLRGKTLYKYTDKKLVDESYYDTDGKLLWKNVFRYDVNNVCIEKSSYFPDGSIDTKESYTYDDLNRITEVSNKGNSESESSKKIYRYDNKGKVSEFAVYNAANQVTSREFYKYDEDGNIAKITTYSITKKFGTTVNELTNMSDFTYFK